MREDYAEYIAEPLYEILQEQNTFVLTTIAERIEKIGKLTPAEAHKVANSLQYAGADLKKIQAELTQYTNQSIAEIEKIFEQVARDNIDFASTYYEHRGIPILPYAENTALIKLVEAAKKQTIGTFINMSNTELIGFLDKDGKFLNLRQQYNKIIDRAIISVQTGTIDYNTAIRASVREMAKSGVKSATFESGYRRRLDSQARMNIIDGIKQLNIDTQEITGKEFGADGVEWSAHSNCAPDHQPYQGRQFTKQEQEQLNDSLQRPVGRRGCKHIVFQIILGVNKPNHSKEQIKELNRKANEKVEYNGKKMSRYQTTQEQRRRETRIRRLKDEQVAFQASGDTQEAKRIQRSINAAQKEYKAFSEKVGLRPKPERTQVPNYKRISVK